MKYEVSIGQTDKTVLVFIPDPAQTDGSGKTGLVAANMSCAFARVETDNDVVVTDVTSTLNDLADLNAAHADWGMKELSAALMPGWYRLDHGDACFAVGATEVGVNFMIASSAAAPAPMEFTLKPAPGTAGGLATVGSEMELSEAMEAELVASIFARAWSAAYGGFTFDQMIRIIVAALVGKLSGADVNAPVIRNLNDTADVVTATSDADGNRTAVALTPGS